MSLIEAWNQEGRTDNGMRTNCDSGSSCLNLFFLAGASRGKDLSTEFSEALGEDYELAIRILLWMRDIRGGAGEREQFKNLLMWLDADTIMKILPFIPEVGRWDDLLPLVETEIGDRVAMFIHQAILEGNGLAAKWMPRKGDYAVMLRDAWKMSPKQYRKFLVHNTKVVETKMCSNQWEDINYSHVPSVASARYRNAFRRHDPDRYSAFIGSVLKGEKEMKARAIFPHDVLKGGSWEEREAQWMSLPNYMEGSEGMNILPVCDVSGSMFMPFTSPTPMEVCLALGLYISERNEGIFKDTICTFSANPSLVKLKATHLEARVKKLKSCPWGMNTDLNKTFKTLLDVAVKHDVPEAQMPKIILIISDMEFDRCTRYDDNAIEMIRRKYRKAGYTIPNVIFWNVNGRSGNIPVRMHETGTALISGYSPSIMKSILSNPMEITPYHIMMSTVMKDRYKWVQ